MTWKFIFYLIVHDRYHCQYCHWGACVNNICPFGNKNEFPMGMYHGRLARWRRWSACDVVKRRNGWKMSSAHSLTLPSLHLRHSSFSNYSVASPTSSWLSNPSVAPSMSRLILQPFRCFTYVTAHSPTIPSLHYVTGTSHTSPVYINWICCFWNSCCGQSLNEGI